MSDSTGPEFDFHRVLIEIEDEVRTKRATGELPADLERELDMVFARFAPAGALEGNFDQLMERAEQQAYFDLLAPNESVRPGVPHVKRVVQKTIRWYMRYIVDQVTGFSHTITKAVRQLGNRVERLEQITVGEDEVVAATSRIDSHIAGKWESQIVEKLAGTTGRVLHARCGSGSLVKSLRANGLDAYGVDPSEERVSAASADPTGLDVRAGTEISHLRLVSPGALSAIVLTGGPDVLPRGAQIELIDLAATALQRGAELILITSNPASWERSHDPVEVDLSPGRPMSTTTWQYLLAERGFTQVAITDAEPAGELTVPGKSDVASKAIDENFRRLNAMLFPPDSSMIVATR